MDSSPLAPVCATDMPIEEAPSVELGSGPQTPSIIPSPSPSEVSSASSPEPHNIRPTPLFRALAITPPEPDQPLGQDILERRLPGYRRIVIPRELTLIELLKQDSGVTNDEDVIQIRQATLKVVAERVGLRRIHVLVPRLRSLTLDGSALSSLRDLGIGLVHLKVLSVNRCGLTSLDGVWGLGALRELHAAKNRVKDLNPVAALQKLHTLEMSHNPIEDASQLWTLGICSSLRNLILVGTPASDVPDYRARVAAALPMLIYLDDIPMVNDVNYEGLEGVFGPATSSSDSEESDAEEKIKEALVTKEPQQEPRAGPSSGSITDEPPQTSVASEESTHALPRRRPATTEGAGVRPAKPEVPVRPRTAVEKRSEMPSKLHIMNTLMDEEWRCSGSKLTSNGPVCGNLARALRRPSSAGPSRNAVADNLDLAVDEATKTIATEIPKVPCPEDWAKFKLDTGIDIDIDFNIRPGEGADATEAIDRLERIEKNTQERMRLEAEGNLENNYNGTNTRTESRFRSSFPFSVDYNVLNLGEDSVFYHSRDVDIDTLYDDLNSFQSLSRVENRIRSNYPN